MKEYMSGSELRQYLHISTRKMKYLMDNNYIPHENTGHATHKYRVLWSDVIEFKRRMDSEQGFLAELNGMFTNRTEWHPVPLLEVTNENRKAFRVWLREQWQDIPDAIPVKGIVRLIGGKPIQIHELIENGTLHGVTVCSKVYCPKSEIINYAASAEKLSNPSSQIYKELIRTFKKHMCRQRENEKRRCKRRSERND
ncbi:MAG: hypothetical protein RR287_07840 [Oscillospiraceae bacterium]